MMRVADVMTREVRTAPPETTLKEVALILAELRVSGLPVVEAGRVVGVVSEADILAKERGESPARSGLLGLLLDDGADLAAKLQARTAGEAMTSPAVTIGPMRSVAEAAGRMIDERVNRLPVVDEDGAIVGIVTRADLVRAFVRSDEEITREIKDDLILRTLWISSDRIDVKVENGEVTIAGHVDSEAEAELVPTFAKKVPGVVSVTSTLTWPDANP
jgi:CBS domain-containing protein